MVRLILIFILLYQFLAGIKNAYSQNISGTSIITPIPISTLSDYSAIGIGLAGHSRFFVLERLGIGFHTAFHYQFGRNGFNGHITIPLRGVAEYYFTDDGARIRPYLGGDLGVAMSTYSGPFRFYFHGAAGGGALFELSEYIQLVTQFKFCVMVGSGMAMYLEPSIGFNYKLGY
ncbi:MAG: hypothetical protein N2167_08700 [Flavobacteriales bacterium]|nr:hypothetical protein [Flavobacteriales bacterium]